MPDRSLFVFLPILGYTTSPYQQKYVKYVREGCWIMRLSRFVFVFAIALLGAVVLIGLSRPQTTAQAQCAIEIGGSVTVGGVGRGEHVCRFSGQANQNILALCDNCLEIAFYTAAGNRLAGSTLPATGQYQVRARYDYGAVQQCTGGTYFSRFDCEQSTGRMCSEAANGFCPNNQIGLASAPGQTTITLDNLFVPRKGTLLISLVRITGGVLGRIAPEVGLYQLDPVTLQSSFISRLGQDQSFSLSPDGRTIALTYNDTRNLRGRIALIGIDGSDPRFVTPEKEIAYGPAWSPDGTQIAYISGPTAGDIYVMNADGSNPRPLIDLSTKILSVRWSPDGQRLYFDAEVRSKILIYTADADGKNIRELALGNANWGYERPIPSPDGTQIMYAAINGRTAAGLISEIGIANADGSNPRLITDGVIRRKPLGWSPDGTTVFYSIPLSRLTVGVQGQIYALSTDGKTRSRVAAFGAPSGFSEGVNMLWLTVGGVPPAPTPLPTEVAAPEPTQPPDPAVQQPGPIGNQTMVSAIAPVGPATQAWTFFGRADEFLQLLVQTEAFNPVVRLEMERDGQRTTLIDRKSAITFEYVLPADAAYFLYIEDANQSAGGPYLMVVNITDFSGPVLTLTPSSTPAANLTPDLVGTSVAATLNALQQPPTQTPDLVATLVAGTLAAALPTATPTLPPTITPFPTFPPSPEPTETPAFDCPGAPPTILYIGQRGRIAVGDGTPANLRREPTTRARVVRTLPVLTAFDIIGGPVCGVNSRNVPVLWWQVRLLNGVTTGWVVEGTFEERVIEPLN